MSSKYFVFKCVHDDFEMWNLNVNEMHENKKIRIRLLRKTSSLRQRHGFQ